jgi:hypothetical protein
MFGYIDVSLLRNVLSEYLRFLLRHTVFVILNSCSKSFAVTLEVSRRTVMLDPSDARFVVDKVPLGRVFSSNTLVFPCDSHSTNSAHFSSFDIILITRKAGECWESSNEGVLRG